MMQSTLTRALAIGALSLVSSAQSAVPTHYTVTRLEALFESTAVDLGLGLSNAGHVTGEGTAPAGDPATNYGFAWHADRLVRIRQSPGAPAWLRCAAREVNDQGAVIGTFGLSPTITGHGFHWQGGVATELLDPVGFAAFPSEINSAGWIVGTTAIVTMPGVQPEGVVWNPNLQPSWVGDFVSAQAINELGVIAGQARDGAGHLFAAIHDQGVTTILGTLDPGGTGASTAFSLNDSLQVVGTSKHGFSQRAFSWTAATGMVELDGLGVVGDGAYASAVNAGGLILGNAPIASGGSAAVLWDAQLVPHQLAPLVPDMAPGSKWLGLGVPRDLNDWGQIAGSAYHVPTAQVRAYLLTPAALTLASSNPARAGSPYTVMVSGVEPHTLVSLFGDLHDALDRGYHRLPGCGGMGLSMASPRLLARSLADADGDALLTWNVPSNLAGKVVRFQAAAPSSCAISNVLELGL